MTSTHPRDRTVTAVLGPTNTGKTTYAIERMLGHKTGVMGFPLRLLAREVYDRIVEMRGPSVAALVTGEEKIVPATARYFICTVESMPVETGADFVAVDEIQLCADPERGHVFTDRLLGARGMHETLFLGAMTMRDSIRAMIPEAQFVFRERYSVLSYAGTKKISRLPARSAVVAFSTDQVYAIAELLRRQKGGAAVVMGALSPRTRNAQVKMFQDGEVEYLVATDAIGMGLNLDLKSVWFAGSSKFDGRKHRRLEAEELAQIAGRAGRYTNDGTFGVSADCRPLDPELVEAIEEHRFRPIGALQWRNSALNYANPDALLKSLDMPAPVMGLQRTREADDVAALRILCRDPDIRDMTRGAHATRLLWDVCQIPDFRKTMMTEHVDLLARIYGFLTGPTRVIPEEWMRTQVQRIDKTDGDIDVLSKRLAFIRTWTYAANRTEWLQDAKSWRERTRAVEDRLSDALHSRLTQRFVDRRTSVLMRRLKQKEDLVATVEKDGRVTVEGEHVGRIEGLRFQPDKEAEGVHGKTLRAASTGPVAAELTQRVERLYACTDSAIDFTEQGGIVWDNVVIGRLEKGADPLSPVAKVFTDELLETTSIERAQRRCQQWIERKIAAQFEPLLALKNDEAITGIGKGVAFQVVEALGILPRGPVAGDVKAIEQDVRGIMRKHGLRFGQYTLFMPLLLKPAPTRLRVMLWGLSQNLEDIPAPPPPGVVTFTAPEGVPNAYFPIAGYRRAGTRALRLDMLERLTDMLRPLDARKGFEATADMLSITGLTLEQFADLMSGMGFRGEKGERPKVKPAPKTPAETATTEDSMSAADTAPEPENAPISRDAPAQETETDTESTEDGGGPETPVAKEGSTTTDAGDEPEQDVANLNVAQTNSAETDSKADKENAPQSGAAPAPAEQSRPSTTDAPAAETESASSADDAPEVTPEKVAAAETEVFYTFRILPRGRQQRGDAPRRKQPSGNNPKQQRNGPPGGEAGPAKPVDTGQDTRKAKAENIGGRGRPNRKKHPGKGRPPTKQQPQTFQSAPPKQGGKLDPDSPFAILQRLKDGK